MDGFPKVATVLIVMKNTYINTTTKFQSISIGQVVGGIAVKLG